MNWHILSICPTIFLPVPPHPPSVSVPTYITTYRECFKVFKVKYIPKSVESRMFRSQEDFNICKPRSFRNQSDKSVSQPSRPTRWDEDGRQPGPPRLGPKCGVSPEKCCKHWSVSTPVEAGSYISLSGVPCEAQGRWDQGRWKLARDRMCHAVGRAILRYRIRWKDEGGIWPVSNLS